MTTIHLEPRSTERGQRCFDWIEALGLDPHVILAYQDAMIRDGHVTLTRFVLDSDGARIHEDTDGEWSTRKTIITVPLTADPADYGITTS